MTAFLLLMSYASGFLLAVHVLAEMREPETNVQAISIGLLALLWPLTVFGVLIRLFMIAWRKPL
ncbi:hypothetical protein [Aestuariivirga sp.]|uniref:hypothetical protein n=1 Tax=Aestuariivirga sp. TaxID=2650926 RepID=UPI0039E51022